MEVMEGAGGGSIPSTSVEADINPEEVIEAIYCIMGFSSSPKGSFAEIGCRSIGVGDYNWATVTVPTVQQTYKVVFTKKGILFTLPHAKHKNKAMTCAVPIETISSFAVHYGRRLPVIFVKTGPKYATWLRKKLGLSEVPAETNFFCSLNGGQCQKYITFLPYCFTETDIDAITAMFGKTIHQLVYEEANELLKRITPNQKMQDAVNSLVYIVAYADKNDPHVGQEKKEVKLEDKVRVIYQFVNDDNGVQLKGAHADLGCPWCSVNYPDLYYLLQHLKICQSGFHFLCTAIVNAAQVDVSINDSYDNFYSGSICDAVFQSSGQTAADWKKYQTFFMIVFRPAPLRQISIDGETQKGEMDAEFEEGQQDYAWHLEKSDMLIDDFTDVKSGEKAIMKMWNHHVRNDNYLGDYQIPMACIRFVQRYGTDIIKKNLYQECVLHLTNLYHFQLLTKKLLVVAVKLIRKQMHENDTTTSLMEKTCTSNILTGPDR